MSHQYFKSRLAQNEISAQTRFHYSVLRTLRAADIWQSVRLGLSHSWCSYAPENKTTQQQQQSRNLPIIPHLHKKRGERAQTTELTDPRNTLQVFVCVCVFNRHVTIFLPMQNLFDELTYCRQETEYVASKWRLSLMSTTSLVLGRHYPLPPIPSTLFPIPDSNENCYQMILKGHETPFLLPSYSPSSSSSSPSLSASATTVPW